MSTDPRIQVACTHCGQKVAVARTSLGKNGRCPKCQQIFVLQLPGQMPPPAVQKQAPQKPAPRPAPAPNDDLFADLPVQREQPVQQAASPFAEDDYNLSMQPEPAAAPQAASPHVHSPTSIAQDYLRRAKDDEPVTKQEERDPTYRFMTSWGGIIGGAAMFLGGIFVFLFISFRLGIIMAIVGGGWFVQGLNYLFYYIWKDQQGK